MNFTATLTVTRESLRLALAKTICVQQMLSVDSFIGVRSPKENICERFVGDDEK